MIRLLPHSLIINSQLSQTGCIVAHNSQITISAADCKLADCILESLIKIAPRHCFGVTLANNKRKSIMISYNWGLSD